MIIVDLYQVSNNNNILFFCGNGGTSNSNKLQPSRFGTRYHLVLYVIGQSPYHLINGDVVHIVVVTRYALRYFRNRLEIKTGGALLKLLRSN